MVIGGGLAGACTALAVASRGARCTIIERDQRLVNQASLRNEGKIHLGLIYAADNSFLTAKQQLMGALTFLPLLRRWIGKTAGNIRISQPFKYLVADSSIIGEQALEEHYESVSNQACDYFQRYPRLNYLGSRPYRLASKVQLDSVARYFELNGINAVFDTVEVAVSTEDLADVLRQAVQESPKVEVLTDHEVKSIGRSETGFVLEGDATSGPFRVRARKVVNASWAELFKFDDMVGVAPAPGWLHRLKFRVLVETKRDISSSPSATMVLGPYGDVVVRPKQSTYVSWYPECLRGWSHELSPPKEWSAAITGAPNPAVAREIAQASLCSISAWYPALSGATTLEVDAGVILAHGRSDVGDIHSGLHARTTSGLTSLDDWYSLNPGKLTTAPLIAEQAASMVTRPRFESIDHLPPSLESTFHRVATVI